jgi:hypothetical protein
MDNAKAGPKDFFLWAGAMISLWGGVVAFIALVFDYINYALPNPLEYVSNPYQGGMPYEMASLIVLTPLFLILMRVIRRDIERDPSRNDVWVRRWGLFLTLFIAGVTIAVDLIVLITTFLGGEELSVRFLLKVALVLLVASAGFMHFMADLWGYWKQNPQLVRWVNYAVGVLVVATIVAGFFIVGTPQQAHRMRLDEQRVSDLMSIQSQVTYFYQQKRVVPSSLSQLQDPLLGFVVPVDPSTGVAYEYAKTSDLAFQLCATFAEEGSYNDYGMSRAAVAYPTKPYGNTQDTWEHSAGHVCFERMIDPDFYPAAKPLQ